MCSDLRMSHIYLVWSCLNWNAQWWLTALCMFGGGERSRADQSGDQILERSRCQGVRQAGGRMPITATEEDHRPRRGSCIWGGDEVPRSQRKLGGSGPSDPWASGVTPSPMSGVRGRAPMPWLRRPVGEPGVDELAGGGRVCGCPAGVWPVADDERGGGSARRWWPVGHARPGHPPGPAWSRGRPSRTSANTVGGGEWTLQSQ